jgi:hypothetical protein
MREFIRITCPVCARRVGAEVPELGDGVGVRVSVHKASDKPGADRCEMSERIAVQRGGKWTRTK